MGVAEFHHVLCAKFSRVFANFTATLLPTFKSFLVLFFKKEQYSYFSNFSINQNFKLLLIAINNLSTSFLVLKIPNDARIVPVSVVPREV